MIDITSSHTEVIKNSGKDAVNEAVELSNEWYDSYVDKHTFGLLCFTPEVTAKLAIARYEWILHAARKLIFEAFSNDDLYIIAVSLQREVAIPNDYPIAKAIADDNSILWANRSESKYSTLIEKLLKITPAEEMALRDIVEQFWHGEHTPGYWIPEHMSKQREEAY